MSLCGVPLLQDAPELQSLMAALGNPDLSLNAAEELLQQIDKPPHTADASLDAHGDGFASLEEVLTALNMVGEEPVHSQTTSQRHSSSGSESDEL